jgi:hypothetical protein
MLQPFKIRPIPAQHQGTNALHHDARVIRIAVSDKGDVILCRGLFLSSFWTSKKKIKARCMRHTLQIKKSSDWNSNKPIYRRR